MTKHDNTKKVIEHLEFLGYKIEDSDEGDNNDTHLAKCDGKPSLYIRSNGTAVYIRSFWTGFDARALKSKDFYAKLNQTNSENILVKSSYASNDESDMTITFSSAYFGYDKASFGIFIDTFQDELRKALNILKDFYKE